MQTDTEYSKRYREMVLGKTLRKVMKLRSDFKTLLLYRSDYEILMMLSHLSKRILR